MNSQERANHGQAIAMWDGPLRPAGAVMAPPKPAFDWKGVITIGVMLGGLYVGLKDKISDVESEVKSVKVQLAAVQMQASRVEANAISRESAELIARQVVERETGKRLDMVERRRPVPVLSAPGSSIQ